MDENKHMKFTLKQRNKFNRRVVAAYCVLAAALLGFLWMFFARAGRSTIYHSDAWRQHLRALAYYSKWLRGAVYHIVKEHSFDIQTYAFDLGYGADVITTMQYYCLGDPLAALSALVPTDRIAEYFQALMFVRPFLTGLSFLAFALYVTAGGQREMLRKEADPGPSEGNSSQNQKEFFQGEQAAVCGNFAPGTGLVAGALIYVFSGTVLYIGMLHPFFVNPMIWFPLLLLGVEKILREKRPALFMAVTALAALSSFYYFYMMAILTALYGIARIWQEGRRKECSRKGPPDVCRNGQKVKGTGPFMTVSGYVPAQALKILGYALVGTAMAGVTLVPVLVQFENDPRAATSFHIPLLYSGDYYRELLRNLLTWVNHPQYDVELCFGGAALALTFVLLSLTGFRFLKGCLAVLTLMLLFPAAGTAMGGFAYLIDRWTWACALLIGMVTAQMFPLIGNLQRKNRIASALSGLAFTLLCAVCGVLQYPGVRDSLLVMWVTLGVLCLPGRIARLPELKSGAGRKVSSELADIPEETGIFGTTGRRKLPQHGLDLPVREAAVFALCVIMTGMNIMLANAASMGNFPREFLESMTPDEYHAAAYGTEVRSVDALGGRSDFYRYTGRDLNWNAALSTGISSTQFEFSLANGVVSDYFQAIGNPDEQNFAYFALDDRMIPNMLAGVRYYSLAYDNPFEYQFVPYGFADRGMVGNYHLYQSDFALPAGFTVSGRISQEAFRDMTTTQRQEALLSGAVLDEDSLTSVDQNEREAFAAIPDVTEDTVNSLTEQEVSFSVEPGEGVTWQRKAADNAGEDAAADPGTKKEDNVPIRESDLKASGYAGSFLASEAGQSVTLSFQGVPDAETYLCFDGLCVSGGGALIYPIEVTAFEGDAKTTQKTLKFQTPASQYYSGWKDFAINMGYSGNAVTRLVVTFPAAGTYSFDALRVVCQGSDVMAKGLQLAAQPLRDVNLHKNPVSYASNTITGSIDVTEDRILILNLPYSPGWSAEIDGEEVMPVRADVMFMAVPVSKGSHSVVLRYRTPGGHAGIAVSLAGIALFILLTLYEHKQRA